MVFASQEFLLFLGLLLGLYALVTRRRPEAGRALLIAASLFFYGYWRPSYLLILVGSICANYVVGQRIRRRAGSLGGALWTALGVAGNLALLAYYKYAEFLLENLDRLAQQSFEIPEILLPIGISFFSFQQIAFLVDAQRGRVADLRFGDYFLFVSFFPQLIAGPIVVQSELLGQLRGRRDWRLRSWQIAIGLALFAVGLFKKSVLMDPYVPYIDVLFERAASGQEIGMLDGWVAALGYGFQIYFDFSGYSDMAIGLAFLFGLRLPLNFFSPYQASSLREFWRRWHITLSRFLRDHLYIPLGGSRHGLPRTLLALMVTMGLGGLWHGAGWNFVIWGGLHGLLLVTNHLYDRSPAPRWLRSALAGRRPLVAAHHGLCVLVTFGLVTVAWVLFRAPDLDTAGRLFAAMFGLSQAPSTSRWDGIVPMLPCYLAIVWLAPNACQIFRRFEVALGAERHLEPGRPLPLDALWTYRLGPRWAVATALLFAVDWSFLSAASPFLYFQF